MRFPRALALAERRRPVTTWAMDYRSQAPAPPLAAFIDRLWTLADAPPHERERVLPSGTLELVVDLRDDELRVYDPAGPCRRYSGAIVSGAYRESFIIDTAQHASIIGVHFKPGGAAPFLGVPPGELADAHVDLETLWGSGARELRERLCTAGTTHERFRILEEALRSRLSTRHARHPAVSVALRHLGSPRASVREAAARAEVSTRRLTDLFTAEVGIAPKQFHRVRRFRQALAHVEKPAPPRWSQVALECGYCDQSHLIRELVAFSGFSPMQLRARRSDRVKESHLVV